MGDAVRDVEDMKCLKLVAEELHRELSGRLGRLIRLRSKLPLKESHTNGWRVELGSLGLGVTEIGNLVLRMDSRRSAETVVRVLCGAGGQAAEENRRLAGIASVCAATE